METIYSGRGRACISKSGAFVSSLKLDDIHVLKRTHDRHQTHGGMAVLIPYADIVSNARFEWQGREYRLPKNSKCENDSVNSIHGLVREKPWHIKKKSAESLELGFDLRHRDFPSELSITARYTITNNRFLVEFDVKNTGRSVAPIMCGAHPYFIYDDYWRLQCADRVKWLKNVTSKSKSPVEIRTEEIDCRSFDSRGNRLFDDAFEGGGEIDLLSADRVITLKRRNMPFFEVYNGRYAQGESVAVEPITSAPNSFNNGYGLKSIDTGGTFRCGFSIDMKRVDSG